MARQTRILSDKKLRFMANNGDLSARVQLHEDDFGEGKDIDTIKGAFLEINLNHYGTWSKVRLPFSYPTVSVLIELLEEVRDHLAGKRDRLFDGGTLLDISGKGPNARIIDHPLTVSQIEPILSKKGVD